MSNDNTRGFNTPDFDLDLNTPPDPATLSEASNEYHYMISEIEFMREELGLYEKCGENEIRIVQLRAISNLRMSGVDARPNHVLAKAWLDSRETAKLKGRTKKFEVKCLNWEVCGTINKGWLWFED